MRMNRSDTYLRADCSLCCFCLYCSNFFSSSAIAVCAILSLCSSWVVISFLYCNLSSCSVVWWMWVVWCVLQLAGCCRHSPSLPLLAVAEQLDCWLVLADRKTKIEYYWDYVAHVCVCAHRFAYSVCVCTCACVMCMCLCGTHVCECACVCTRV